MSDGEIGKRLGDEIIENTLLAISRLPDRVSDVSEKLNELDKQLGQLDERVKGNRERLEALEGEVDAVEERLHERLNDMHDRIDAEVKDKRERSRAQFVAIAGLVTAMMGIALTAVLKALGVV